MAGDENLPTMHLELIVVSICMILFSTVFAGWRIMIRFKASPWMRASDWLMMLGVVSERTALIEVHAYLTDSYRR